MTEIALASLLMTGLGLGLALFVSGWLFRRAYQNA